MLGCHEVIARHGVSSARAMMPTKHDRVALDAAAQIISEPVRGDDCVFAGTDVGFLPHKNVDDSLGWAADGGRIRYTLYPSVLNGDVRAGIPYGSKARLLLIYLQDTAIRSGSRIVETGLTMYSWARVAHPRSLGGKTYELIMDQSVRIAGCRVTIGKVETMFVERMISPESASSDGRFIPKYLRDRGGSAMPEWAVLSPAFHASFREQYVRLRLSSLRQISNNSAAIDLYIWLCDFLPRLGAPVALGWDALAAKFGMGYKDCRNMRRPLTRALELALAVYPEARVEQTAGGFLFHPSEPAVAGALRDRAG